MKNYILELPCEGLVCKLMGEDWRNLPAWEIDGAWGIAIVKSVLDGVGFNPMRQVASHLGVYSEVIRDAFTRLNFNGAFLRNKISKDKGLRNGEALAWYSYAGIASGATGNVIPFVSSKRRPVRSRSSK